MIKIIQSLFRNRLFSKKKTDGAGRTGKAETCRPGNAKAGRTLAALLTFSMLSALLAGCGALSGTEKEANTQQTGGGSAAEEDTQQGSDSTAMGRYTEEVTDLSESMVDSGSKRNLCRLEDGSLVISDTFAGFLISKDNGATWEQDRREWFEELQKDQTYIMDMTVGSDNTVGVIYHVEEETEAGTELAEEETDDTESDGSLDVTLNPKLYIIKPDGTKIPADIAATEEDIYINHVYLSDTGRMFATALGSGNIYEIYEDGSSSLFLTLEDNVEQMQFQGNLMIVDAYGFDGPRIYDMEARQYIEDPVLEEFVSANYGDRYDSYMSGAYRMCLFPGEEGVLYLAGIKGLYRHVIGGSTMELVIDGGLCTFGNPAYYIWGMLALENHEFLTLFTGSRLVRYVYDPDIPTVPNEKLKVYSLTENDTIRQAIALYQSANPEIFVEYEIGMGEDSAVTRDDALKNLNTRIMAGEGPDVLILDDMPLASYVDKGLLLDISPIVDTLEGDEELFDNIVDSMKESGQLYAMPCEVQLPVILGPEKYLAQAQDLAGIADAVEAARTEHPGEDIIGICSAGAVMRLFAMTCVPAWTGEDGTVNTDAIADFLMQTERIYNAQMDGIAQKWIDAYNDNDIFYSSDLGIPYDDTDILRTNVDEISYIAGLTCLESGALEFPYSYATVTSVKKTKGFEDSGWIPMGGQSGKVFCAKTLLGISAVSTQTEQAEAFIRVCLGKENQTNLFYGYAVNRAAFEQGFAAVDGQTDEDGLYGMIGFSSDDGLEATMEIYWPDEEERAVLRQYLESADTPYIEDMLLEDTVYTEGAAYIEGDQSLEEAVSEIEKKVALYMAE